MSKRERTTDKIELVETQNLLLALNRLGGKGSWSTPWKRALYHALAMSNVGTDNILEKIRIALSLP